MPVVFHKGSVYDYHFIIEYANIQIIIDMPMSILVENAI